MLPSTSSFDGRKEIRRIFVLIELTSSQVIGIRLKASLRLARVLSGVGSKGMKKFPDKMTYRIQLPASKAEGTVFTLL